MSGTKPPDQTSGQSKGFGVIECIHANGYYPKLLKSESRPKGLHFRNGRATVTSDELAQLKKEKGIWGRQIDIIGRLGRPGHLQQPAVVRGMGPNVLQSGGSIAPVTVGEEASTEPNPTLAD